MKTALVAAFLLLALTGPGLAQPHHFGYTGDTAPAKWGALNPEWRACAEGRNQSPIDLGGFVDAKLPRLDLTYSSVGVAILNNGHAIQVNYAKGSQLHADGHVHAPYASMVHYAPGSSLKHDGRTFELKQFHFHAPSEHTLNGKSFPMEMHLVHADADGHLAVVGVLMAEGPADNPVVAKLWAQMPVKAGDKSSLEAKVNVADLLPKSKDYYRYSGSLTTPPCSEGVRWYVLKQSIPVSKRQIEAFRKAVGSANNRPPQPVNARAVLK
jgi:carbonic anhydrase